MNCSTPDRPRHAPTATVIRVEIVSNDPVDHLRTLRALDRSNPQQTSRLLREARIDGYLREMQVPMIDVVRTWPDRDYFRVYLTVVDGKTRISTFARVKPDEFRRHGLVRGVARVLSHGAKKLKSANKHSPAPSTAKPHLNHSQSQFAPQFSHTS